MKISNDKDTKVPPGNNGQIAPDPTGHATNSSHPAQKENVVEEAGLLKKEKEENDGDSLDKEILGVFPEMKNKAKAFHQGVTTKTA